MKLGSVTPYYKRKVRSNLLGLYGQATSENIDNGLRWYKTANVICNELAMEFDTTTERVAQVLSALSPRNKWERNIIDTRAVLEAVRDGIDPSEVKVCTFNSNKMKAFAIAKGELDIQQESPKTYSFVRNISALDENKVTIDVWHLRACFGKTITSGLTPLRYEELERLTIKLAERLGLRGYEFQAIVWDTIRQKN